MKKNNGITILALVITIIILLILIGITLSVLIGDSGLIIKAQDTAVDVKVAEAEEELSLTWVGFKVDPEFNSLTLTKQAEILENELKKKDSNATVEVYDETKLQLLVHYKEIEKIISSDQEGTSNEYTGNNTNGGSSSGNGGNTSGGNSGNTSGNGGNSGTSSSGNGGNTSGGNTGNTTENDDGNNISGNTGNDDNNGGNGNENENKITVTFNTNGGTLVASQVIDKGTSAEQPANPTKTENDFFGWYIDEELTTVFDFSTVLNQDTTLYARWLLVDDYYTYTVSDNKATITGFSEFGLERYNSGELTKLQFPSSYNDTPVSYIGEDAFRDRINITELDIPSSIQIIKKYAFDSCTGLTKVEITCDTEHYGFAFNNCSNIENVKIKVGATTVMKNIATEVDTFTTERYNRSIAQHHILGAPWYYAKQGVIVEIDNGVTKIGNGTFYDATRIAKIIIPSSVTEIGNNVFCGMTQMTKQTRSETGTNILTIPDTVTTIGTNMCRNCSNLTNYEVPKAMIDSKTINEGTYRSTKISSLENIPVAIETIGDYAFYSCKSIVQTVMPNGIKTIGDYAFYECSNMTNITLSNQLETIGQYAFEYCSSLEKIIIPSSCESLGRYSFGYCSAITRVDVPCDIQYGTDAFYGCSILDKVNIKVGTTTIIPAINDESSGYQGNPTHNIYGTPWYYAKQGVVVEIENGVTEIGNYEFYKAIKIGKIIIPSSVTKIGSSVFCYMTQMTKQTRSGTEINTITIPDTVTTIGNANFYRCSNLASFEVPKAMIDSKKINNSTYRYTKISSLASIPAGIETIEEYAFSNCTELIDVTIPSSIKTIGKYAFQDCTGIENLTIPSSVEWIRISAFSSCTGLKKLETPCDVSYDTYAFSGCSNLEEINIKVGNTTELIEVSINSYGINKKDGTPWYYAKQGEAVVNIGNGITKIGVRVFYETSKPAKIIIPTSVTEIANSAFYGCSNTLQVYYRGTSEQWAAVTKGTSNDKLDSINYNYSGE